MRYKENDIIQLKTCKTYGYVCIVDNENYFYMVELTDGRFIQVTDDELV